ncbi:MAG: acyltransferase family protein [Pseudomonadota bacterium]
MNDKSMQQSQRFHGLDFLRGLMMSLGLVLHSAQMYMVNPVLDYYWDPARSLSMDILLFWINTFRMPVFFMLSGFFTAMLLRRRGPQQMFQDRYRRIVIPFLVFLPPLALVMTALRIIARNVMATGELGFDLNYIEDPEQLWNNTHNLWFLYYLILYIVTLRLAIMWLPSIANIEKSAPTQEVYAPITMLPVCLAFALIGGFSDIGRVSGNLSFVPALDVYLVYGICFAFGVLLYRRIMDLDVLARAWKKYMALATAMFFVALFSLLSKGSMDQLGY